MSLASPSDEDPPGSVGSVQRPLGGACLFMGHSIVHTAGFDTDRGMSGLGPELRMHWPLTAS